MSRMDVLNTLNSEESRCNHCGAFGPLCDHVRGMHCTFCGRSWQSVASAKRQEAVMKVLSTPAPTEEEK